MNRLPYARHSIDPTDVEAVVEVLQSDWLTTGPKITEFESAVSQTLSVAHTVAVNSGTAALHCAMHAAGIGPGDEVIVPAMTFAATANAVLYQGGRPVFADVLSDSLLIDPADVQRKITRRTKCIVGVDYAGAPANYSALREIAERYRLVLVADACHSLGATFHGQPVGSLADLNCFSMHPVKPITSGEGGFVTTPHDYYAQRMRSFRNHGIDSDFRQREAQGRWQYSMMELGFNYRLCDIQAALALSQLKKLPEWTRRRNVIAGWYGEALQGVPRAIATPLRVPPAALSAFHLFVVRWNRLQSSIDRNSALNQMRQRGIGVNVHYLPVYLHPYYQRRLRFRAEICPVAEQAAREIISLPMFPAMSETDVQRVVAELEACSRSSEAA